MIVSTAMRTDEQIHYDAMLSAYGKVGSGAHRVDGLGPKAQLRNARREVKRWVHAMRDRGRTS